MSAVDQQQQAAVYTPSPMRFFVDIHVPRRDLAEKMKERFLRTRLGRGVTIVSEGSMEKHKRIHNGYYDTGHVIMTVESVHSKRQKVVDFVDVVRNSCNHLADLRVIDVQDSRDDPKPEDDNNQDDKKQDEKEQDEKKQDEKKQDDEKQDEKKQDDKKQDDKIQDEKKQDDKKQDEKKQDDEKQDENKQDEKKQDDEKQDENKQDDKKQNVKKQNGKKRNGKKQNGKKQNNKK